MILQNIISLQTPFRRDKSRDPIKTTWEFITKVGIALVFHDHVGFPLRHFTDLLCIHGYHPTLYIIKPPLSGHLLSSHPPLSGQ